MSMEARCDVVGSKLSPVHLVASRISQKHDARGSISSVFLFRLCTI
jgi:hypothetical protein